MLAVVKEIEVIGIPALELTVPRQEVRRSPRISVKLPFSFQRVERKIVVPERMPGTILDVGYHGVLADMRRDVPLHSEIKLGFELQLEAAALRADAPAGPRGELGRTLKWGQTPFFFGR